MKWIVILLIMFFWCTGCSPEAKQKTYSAMPPELADCKVYFISEGFADHMTVIRCPNSTTSVTKQEGKTKRTYVVIDGKAYEKGE